MGVYQFTSFVDINHKHLFKQHFDVRKKSLIFDGNSLFYSLIKRTPLLYGGNYNDIYNTFKKYFQILKSLEITPYIVIDGACNLPIKLETILSRKAKNIKALKTLSTRPKPNDLPKPLFTQHVFIQVLRDMEINHVVAEREADIVLAVLSNKLQCPVVSNDSDFYLLDVQHGVVTTHSMLHISQKQTKILLYNIENLVSLLSVQKGYLKFISLILGNDYSNDMLLDKIQFICAVDKSSSITKRVQKIIEFLKKHSSESEIMASLIYGDNADEIQIEIDKIFNSLSLLSVEEEAMKLLDILNSQNNEHFKYPLTISTHEDVSSMLFVNADETNGGYSENSIKELVYKGLVDACVLNITSLKTHLLQLQAENLSRQSCHNISTTLRQYIYMILFHRNGGEIKMTEYQRKADTVKPITTLLNAENYAIPNISNKKDSLDFLCNTTNFKLSLLDNIGEHGLFTVATHYWINQSNCLGFPVKLELLQALVISYINLYNDINIPNSSVDLFNVDTAHHCCSWQSILFYMVLLNALSNYPLKPIQMNRTFNGNNVHVICDQLTKGNSTPGDFLPVEHMQLFTSIIQACCDGVQLQTFNEEKKKRKKQKKRKISGTDCYSANNRFGALREDGED